MPTALQDFSFDPVEFEKELKAFEHLLTNPELTEANDIQPFFKSNLHLSAYIGTYSPDLGIATSYQFEYGLFGDYRTDLILGNKVTKEFCVVEFEDGGTHSIFKKQPGRGNPEWSRRFDHGFSQIVDWFYALDDYKKTGGFAQAFGGGEVNFMALLVIGRDLTMSDSNKQRLKWRTSRVLIGSQRVHCITFDELFRVLSQRYHMYRDASRLETRSPRKRKS